MFNVFEKKAKNEIVTVNENSRHWPTPDREAGVK